MPSNKPRAKKHGSHLLKDFLNPLVGWDIDLGIANVDYNMYV